MRYILKHHGILGRVYDHVMFNQNNYLLERINQLDRPLKALILISGAENCKPRPPPESNDNKDARDHKEAANGSSNVIAAQTFTFRELAMATKNFRRECLIGEGGFGRVYKGKLDKGGQVCCFFSIDVSSAPSLASFKYK